jgi:hypothetical protein
VTVFCCARAVIADSSIATNSGGTRRFINGVLLFWRVRYLFDAVNRKAEHA